MDMGDMVVIDPGMTSGEAEKLEKEGKSKRSRPRHQKLYSDIRKQMEFYFSDANITKNRLMKDMVQGSEYVSLDTFLGFNKILALTKNMDELRKALKQSEKLQLSDDGLGVKRKVPFDETKLKDEQTVESCTIYIENIPRNVGHEWIEKMFQEFGSIAYISVPKYRKSGQSKGFAFIEFDEQLSADRCLEAYGSMGACLSTNIDPSDLLSVKSFEEEHHSQSGTPREKTSPNDDKAGTNGSGPSGCASAPSRKRNIDTSDADTDPEIKAKKEKRDVKPASERSESNENESKSRKRGVDPAEVSKPVGEAEAKKRKLRSDTKSTLEESISSITESDDIAPDKPVPQQPHAVGSKESKKKKKRRKNKKNSYWKETDVQLENDSIQLRILPKASWRKLRNRYLNLQRENMSKLKKQLKQRKERMQEDPRNQKADRKFAARSICVKITLKTPAESVDVFRSLIYDLCPKDWDNFLKFVDYKEGDLEALVRFDGGPQAMLGVNMFFQNSVGLFKDAIVLSEEETTAYWMTVKGTVKTQSKPKKVIRGKDRLTNEAMKGGVGGVHIRFEEDNDSQSHEEQEGDDSS